LYSLKFLSRENYTDKSLQKEIDWHITDMIAVEGNVCILSGTVEERVQKYFDYIKLWEDKNQ